MNKKYVKKNVLIYLKYFKNYLTMMGCTVEKFE